jgi:adenylate cyclase
MEIERKYLLSPNIAYYLESQSLPYGKIEQMYIVNDDQKEVRLRSINGGSEFFITYKGSGGLMREELEFRIDPRDADKARTTMLGSKPKVTKTRYYLDRWEIDVFHGHLEGLFMMEIELFSENEVVDMPWELERYVELEVTKFKTCKNKHLANLPDLKTFHMEYNREVLRNF